MFSGSFVRFTAYIWNIPNPTSVFGRSISHSSCKQNIKIVLNKTSWLILMEHICSCLTRWGRFPMSLLAPDVSSHRATLSPQVIPRGPDAPKLFGTRNWQIRWSPLGCKECHLNGVWRWKVHVDFGLLEWSAGLFEPILIIYHFGVPNLLAYRSCANL